MKFASTIANAPATALMTDAGLYRTSGGAPGSGDALVLGVCMIIEN
ncbi:MAG: hypothetical protein PHU34_09000 [Candidatus Methanoperedens sp.]|nr:hypothetical protein [Candidatus Methanoperedens sp.]